LEELLSELGCKADEWQAALDPVQAIEVEFRRSYRVRDGRGPSR
jgi:hypothetical protein